MERMCNIISFVLLLFSLPCVCASTEQLSSIQQALASLEDWINKVDSALQEKGIYNENYSPWSECNVTCGLGYRWRQKIGCDPAVHADCTQEIYCNAFPCPVEPKPKKTRYATCALRPNEDLGSSGTVQGLITFTQVEHGALVISANVTGFSVQAADADGSLLDHGFHIHQYGDLSGGCGSAGGHFNPKGVAHGGRLDSIRHVGDLGNLRQTPEGEAITTIVDERASMFGENSIIGRAIVIHRDQDDLGRGGDEGSAATGNAGPRLACCVIGVASGE